MNILKTITPPVEDDLVTKLAEKVAALEVICLLQETRIAALEGRLGAPAPVDVGYVSQATAAARLRLSRQRISQLCATGRLASVVFASRRLVEAASLRAYEEMQD